VRDRSHLLIDLFERVSAVKWKSYFDWVFKARLFYLSIPFDSLCIQVEIDRRWGKSQYPTQHIWFLGTSLDPLSFLPSLSYWVPRFLLKPSFWSPDSCLVASSVHLRSSSVHLRSSP
jgi:hypothetical protein